MCLLTYADFVYCSYRCAFVPGGFDDPLNFAESDAAFESLGFADFSKFSAFADPES